MRERETVTDLKLPVCNTPHSVLAAIRVVLDEAVCVRLFPFLRSPQIGNHDSELNNVMTLTKVQKPYEGSMLTVIRTFPSILNSLSRFSASRKIRKIRKFGRKVASVRTAFTRITTTLAQPLEQTQVRSDRKRFCSPCC